MLSHTHVSSRRAFQNSVLVADRGCDSKTPGKASAASRSGGRRAPGFGRENVRALPGPGGEGAAEAGAQMGPSLGTGDLKQDP